MQLYGIEEEWNAYIRNLNADINVHFIVVDTSLQQIATKDIHSCGLLKEELDGLLAMISQFNRGILEFICTNLVHEHMHRSHDSYFLIFDSIDHTL